MVYTVDFQNRIFASKPMVRSILTAPEFPTPRQLFQPLVIPAIGIMPERTVPGVLLEDIKQDQTVARDQMIEMETVAYQRTRQSSTTPFWEVVCT